ncbi:hypothetical protein HAX54_015733 [Datura stramonium]|uniref:Uncharacterized protein n=1 Tax=Datura stramonium TaxID=4076 RepID=A0ABS8UJT9_DATST|nr:hypothetical protein [Datura stramonium]
MSGMGDGYVGTAQDAVRIRRRKAESREAKFRSSRNKTALHLKANLVFFNLGPTSGSAASEIVAYVNSHYRNMFSILETAFKKETVGLVTREQYVEKGRPRVTIKTKLEEEEKEKLQKLQQEEEELQLQSLKRGR